MAPVLVVAAADARYQLALGLLVGLIAVIAAEMRAGGESGGSQAPGMERASATRRGVGLVVSALLAVGFAAGLRAVLRPPGHGWELAIVVASLLAGVGAAATLPFLPVRGRFRPRLALGVGAAVAVAAAVVVLAPATGGRSLAVYRVIGTCSNHGCGLSEHVRPSQAAPIAHPLPSFRPRYQDGDEVRVACRRRGGAVRDRHGNRSSTWDRLADGGWVSDLFLDTPAPRSPEAIPPCRA